ncbi:MAG: hypothetical protein LBJ31_10365 [Treponema sp.]|jgi:ATP-dependent DNA ligase|nr:hypothetical protein [Treponema sp.]
MNISVDKTKLDNSHGYAEGTQAAIGKETLDIVSGYKKNVCKNFISVNPGQIDDRLSGSNYFVTRKYDGELAVLFWNGGECFAINTGGRVRMGLPCLEDAAKCFLRAGYKNAVVAAELFAPEDKGRTRVFDVLAALADKSLYGSLQLAPFDIISLDDQAFKANSYADIHKTLAELFNNSELCRPVRLEKAETKAQVKDIFAKWVNEEGGEGLVVRSELSIVYKVKPRYTVDAAVVGFSEGSGAAKGQIRTLLVALMTEDGAFQIAGKCGNGFDESFRTGMVSKLREMRMESKYMETDSNHVAFQMIRPEIVIEVNVNDILFETSSGPIFNTRLEIKNNEYRRTASVPGISMVFPVFSRIRDDKSVNPVDVRLAQVDAIVYNPYVESAGAPAELEKSQLLSREVFKKTLGAKFMVQKFLVWKTNKEGQGYPAFCFSYTNFSSDRTQPLQSEVRVSNSEEQIRAFCEEFKDRNIKKGWTRIDL